MSATPGHVDERLGRGHGRLVVVAEPAVAAKPVGHHRRVGPGHPRIGRGPVRGHRRHSGALRPDRRAGEGPLDAPQRLERDEPVGSFGTSPDVDRDAEFGTRTCGQAGVGGVGEHLGKPGELRCRGFEQAPPAARVVGLIAGDADRDRPAVEVGEQVSFAASAAFAASVPTWSRGPRWPEGTDWASRRAADGCGSWPASSRQLPSRCPMIGGHTPESRQRQNCFHAAVQGGKSPGRRCPCTLVLSW